MVFSIFTQKRGDSMNRLVTYMILAAAVLVSGAVAYFIVQKHRQLIDED